MRSATLLLFVLMSISALALAEPSLSVTGNPYEGSALFLRVADSEAAPEVELSREVRSFANSGDGVWETVVPLPLDSGGSTTLTVTAGEESWTRTFEIQPRSYGHQSITLNPATLASYDDPQNKADDEAILQALLSDDTERLFRGNFRYPVSAPQTTGFGLRRTYNGWKKGWHKGLDLAGWEGQPVLAPAPAVVIHTARGIVNGNTVVLSHGAGVGSVYLHLDSIQVKKGQRLDTGQVLGTVGGTGGFAPHLHWETRAHGVPVNPKVFFNLPEQFFGREPLPYLSDSWPRMLWRCYGFTA